MSAVTVISNCTAVDTNSSNRQRCQGLLYLYCSKPFEAVSVRGFETCTSEVGLGEEGGGEGAGEDGNSCLRGVCVCVCVCVI